MPHYLLLINSALNDTLLYVILSPPVTEYVESMETKVKPLLEKKQFLSESQMQKFGKKDPEAYPLLYFICNYRRTFSLIS